MVLRRRRAEQAKFLHLSKQKHNFYANFTIHSNLSPAKGLTPVVNMHEFMAIKSGKAVGGGDNDSTDTKSWRPFTTTEM